MKGRTCSVFSSFARIWKVKSTLAPEWQWAIWPLNSVFGFLKGEWYNFWKIIGSRRFGAWKTNKSLKKSLTNRNRCSLTVEIAWLGPITHSIEGKREFTYEIRVCDRFFRNLNNNLYLQGLVIETRVDLIIYITTKRFDRPQQRCEICNFLSWSQTYINELSLKA